MDLDAMHSVILQGGNLKDMLYSQLGASYGLLFAFDFYYTLILLEITQKITFCLFYLRNGPGDHETPYGW